MVVSAQTEKYLSGGPAETQTAEGVGALIQELKALEVEADDEKAVLTPAEKLQAVNLRLAQPVEVHLVVEECAERFDEDQVNRIVDIITRNLEPAPDASAAQEEEAAAGDEEAQ